MESVLIYEDLQLTGRSSFCSSPSSSSSASGRYTLMYRQSSWPSSSPGKIAFNIHPMFFFTGSFQRSGKYIRKIMVGFTRDIVVLDWLGARFASISHPLPRLCRNRQAEAKVSKGGFGKGYLGEGGERRAAWRLPVTLPVAPFKSSNDSKLKSLVLLMVGQQKYLYTKLNQDLQAQSNRPEKVEVYWKLVLLI